MKRAYVWCLILMSLEAQAGGIDDLSAVSDFGNLELSNTKAIIEQANGADNSARILQNTLPSGSANYAEGRQNGASNSLNITQDGNGNQARIIQDGFLNTASLIQIGSNNRADLAQTGDGNYFEGSQIGQYNLITMTQPGYASAIVNENGNNNSVNLNLASHQRVEINLVGNGRVVDASTIGPYIK